MIHYSNEGVSMFLKLCRFRGSVFPKAFLVAFPNALLTYFTVLNKEYQWIPNVLVQNNEKDGAIWTGFTTFVVFLVVFRTGQSYSRFWDGVTEVYKMRSLFFECCSTVISFTKYSDNPAQEVKDFLHLLIRLFSLLHVSALGQLEEGSSDGEPIKAWNYELLDVKGLDPETLLHLEQTPRKAELVGQWIYQLVVINMKTGIMSIPPPVLSRCFQTLSEGMVHFHDAMRITQIPFPFPYAQLCDTVVLLHWLLIPFAVAARYNSEYWAAVFAFVQVFFAWSLSYIAMELENPFGHDANDLDSSVLQEEANSHFIMLVHPGTRKTPLLATSDPTDSLLGLCRTTSRSDSSLNEAWRESRSSRSTTFGPLVSTTEATQHCSMQVECRTSWSVSDSTARVSHPEIDLPIDMTHLAEQFSNRQSSRRDMEERVCAAQLPGTGQQPFPVKRFGLDTVLSAGGQLGPMMQLQNQSHKLKSSPPLTPVNEAHDVGHVVNASEVDATTCPTCPVLLGGNAHVVRKGGFDDEQVAI